MEYSFH